MWWVNPPQLTNIELSINVMYNLAVWAKWQEKELEMLPFCDNTGQVF